VPVAPPIHRVLGLRTQQQLDRERGSAHARGYDTKWRRLRLVILANEPLCRSCREAGLTEPATEVDHIDGNARHNAVANLRPLCKPCHSRRTARDQGLHSRR
jgi:5-methylcytosine-specific restriction enzyme A